MSESKLSPAQIALGMSQLNAWTHDVSQECILKEWNFESFKTAMRAIAGIGELAERYDHHPEILSMYTRVRIKLFTHDAGGLTSKDFELAGAMDRLIDRNGNILSTDER
jgi:4a-hydroxytetrahydrobiopterin dehydratase